MGEENRARERDKGGGGGVWVAGSWGAGGSGGRERASNGTDSWKCQLACHLPFCFIPLIRSCHTQFSQWKSIYRVISEEAFPLFLGCRCIILCTSAASLFFRLMRGETIIILLIVSVWKHPFEGHSSIELFLIELTIPPFCTPKDRWIWFEE